MASGPGYTYGFSHGPQATYGFAGYRAGGARPMGMSTPYALSYPGMSGRAPSGQRPVYGGRNMTLGSDFRAPMSTTPITPVQSQQPVQPPPTTNSAFTLAPMPQVPITPPSPYQGSPSRPAPVPVAPKPAPQMPWFAPQVEAMQKIISAFSAPAQFDRQLYRRGSEGVV